MDDSSNVDGKNNADWKAEGNAMKFEANRKKEVQRIVRFTDFLASFVHGKSIVKNKFITLSLLSIDMNRNLRTNIIRYLLGINFSDKLITKMERK